MGRDNHPSKRQQRRLERREALIQQYERILVVSEGAKTEPNYLKDIMKYYRVPSASYCILPSQYGTSPKQVVEFAQDLFLNGDPRQRIKKRAFERVYAVFDRDEHGSYHEALKMAERFSNNAPINDHGESILFRSIVSIPNFELWLLLHYKLVHETVSRHDVVSQLKHYIPDYEKGNKGYFQHTREHLEVALRHSKKLAESTNPYDGNMPYTDVGALVEFLIKIKR
jgi:hypothetical protein